MAACAVACLAGTAAGKTLLNKAAIQDLGVRWEAAQAAVRVLRTKKEWLQPVVETLEAGEGSAKGKKKARAGVAWLPEPEVMLKAMWTAPGCSRLRNVTIPDEVSKAEQEEA